MKLVFTILFSLLLCGINISAQEASNNIDGWHVSIVPSALINVWIGAQAKVEYGLMNQLGINLNAAYIFGNNSKNVSATGYRLRPSIRYYFNPDPYSEDRFFVGLGYLHRHTVYNTEGSIIRAGGQFFERTRYDKKTVLNGNFLMFGARTQIGGKFWIESSIGLGLGKLKVTNEGLPSGAELRADLSFRLITFDNEGTSGFGIIIAHFAIGMRIF